MKNSIFRLSIVLAVALSVLTLSCKNGKSGDGNGTTTEQAAKTGKEYTSKYICPMHCEGSGSDEPGTCPVCGMEYVENDKYEQGD